MQLVRHHTAAELRRLVRSETHAKVVRRLQAVLGVLEGQPLPELAAQVQLSGRSIYTWVGRYNERGLDGLRDRPGRGRKGPLSPDQEGQLKARLHAGATADDGVCTLRGEDVRRILKVEFGVVRGLRATDNLLHALGFSVLRPRHSKTDPAAQDAFKKSARDPRRNRRPTPGQDPRSPVRRRVPLRAEGHADDGLGGPGHRPLRRRLPLVAPELRQRAVPGRDAPGANPSLQRIIDVGPLPDFVPPYMSMLPLPPTLVPSSMSIGRRQV